eukprot:2530436-Prymnesium_polylepis.1
MEAEPFAHLVLPRARQHVRAGSDQTAQAVARTARVPSKCVLQCGAQPDTDLWRFRDRDRGLERFL